MVELHLSQSTFTNNTSLGGNGGGLFAQMSDLTITASTMMSNTVTGFGGAVYLQSCNVYITNTTINLNQATSGAGIYSK
jgi:fibronectin-binding autotransporter adhesin